MCQGQRCTWNMLLKKERGDAFTCMAPQHRKQQITAWLWLGLCSHVSLFAFSSPPSTQPWPPVASSQPTHVLPLPPVPLEEANGTPAERTHCGPKPRCCLLYANCCFPGGCQPQCYILWEGYEGHCWTSHPSELTPPTGSASSLFLPLCGAAKSSLAMAASSHASAISQFSFCSSSDPALRRGKVLLHFPHKRKLKTARKRSQTPSPRLTSPQSPQKPYYRNKHLLRF